MIVDFRVLARYIINTLGQGDGQAMNQPAHTFDDRSDAPAPCPRMACARRGGRLSLEALMFTKLECELLLASLDQTRKAFEAYAQYPTPEYKAERIALVDSARDKVLNIKKGATA